MSKKLYTEEEVEEAVESAFYDGFEAGQSGVEYADDGFLASSYLPKEKENEQDET